MKLGQGNNALLLGCLGLSIMSLTSLHSRGLSTEFPASIKRTGLSLGANAPGADDPTPRTPLDDDKDRPDSFSACLMWMDDNFRLYEWLAYHYYMMNLRYVVVHVDPRSRTSLNTVLDLWRDRIHFVVWSHASNFTNDTYDMDEAKLQGDQLSRARSQVFVLRQLDFYLSCAGHLMARNRSWTSFTDSDEFLVATEPSNVSIREIQEEPGVLWRVFQKYSRRHDDPKVLNRYNESDFWQFRDWDLWFSARPCIILPRLLIGAVESNESEVRKGVPDFLDPYRFDTARWRIQGTVRTASDGPGKGFVDLSRITWDMYDEIVALKRVTGSVHRPFGKYCTHSWPTGTGPPLIMNHYLGSWESYSYRDDARKGLHRSYKHWQEQAASASGGINDLARPWMQGFVNMVGDKAAKALLGDAGLPRSYTMTANETAAWGGRSGVTHVVL